MNETEQALSAEEHAASMAEYVADGIRRAEALGNRGPAKFTQAGYLTPEILDAYHRHGFYVFEGLVDSGEVALLQDAMLELLDRAPTDNYSGTDRHGRPAFGQEFARNPYSMIRPLTDPWGGTELLGGRHQTKMAEPCPDLDSPERVVFLMHGMCQIMDPGLRLYGHPDLLAIAASINGDDFVPYNDAIFVKQPGVGGSVSWHQDGVTHWDSPDWDEDIHGFNFQVQLFDTSARSCLWVVPGSHRLGKIDIRALKAANGGSERLPNAVPLYCRAGDVTIVNRQALHCSFANTSPDLRVSLTFGFHRRASVLGARGALSQQADEVYDAARIRERASVIPVAIDARAQFYPEEPRFNYQPFAGEEADFRLTPDTWNAVIRDYNLKDLSI